MSNEQLERNKQVVARLHAEFFDSVDPNGSPNIGLIDEIVHEDYKQHNPLAGQGREGLREFLTNVLHQVVSIYYLLNKDSTVGSKLLYVNMAAEGDLVFRQEVRESFMLLDVYRLRDGMLVEHWDAMRAEPGTMRCPGF